MMRPTFGKMRVSVTMAILALAAATMLGIYHRTAPAETMAPTNTRTPSKPEKILFDEAAHKRFPIRKAEILSLVESKDQSQVKSSLSREMMISRLMTEALDHRPELLNQAKDHVHAKMPRILHLKQSVAGDTIEATLVVADTRKCRALYEETRPVSINLDGLFDRYCVDQHFDYPGGFRPDLPIEVAMHPMSTLGQWEGLDNDYDRLVKTELRRLIVLDFAQMYAATGRLSYAP